MHDAEQPVHAFVDQRHTYTYTHSTVGNQLFNIRAEITLRIFQFFFFVFMRIDVLKQKCHENTVSDVAVSHVY